MQTNKRTTPKRPQVRSLKIQPKSRRNVDDSLTYFPEIRLNGVWLEKIGFHYGNRVEITMLENVMILTPKVG